MRIKTREGSSYVPVPRKNPQPRTSLQHGVCITRLEVLLRHALGQRANDLEDLLVVIAEAGLRVGVVGREARDIAILFFWHQRRRSFNPHVGHRRSGSDRRRSGRTSVLLEHGSREVIGARRSSPISRGDGAGLGLAGLFASFFGQDLLDCLVSAGGWLPVGVFERFGHVCDIAKLHFRVGVVVAVGVGVGGVVHLGVRHGGEVSCV